LGFLLSTGIAFPSQVAAGQGVTLKRRHEELGPLDDHLQHEQMLRDICAWLVINAMRTEQLQAGHNPPF
jgi:hypothetical protein